MALLLWTMKKRTQISGSRLTIREVSAPLRFLFSFMYVYRKNEKYQNLPLIIMSIAISIRPLFIFAASWFLLCVLLLVQLTSSKCDHCELLCSYGICAVCTVEVGHLYGTVGKMPCVDYKVSVVPTPTLSNAGGGAWRLSSVLRLVLGLQALFTGPAIYGTRCNTSMYTMTRPILGAIYRFLLCPLLHLLLVFLQHLGDCHAGYIVAPWRAMGAPTDRRNMTVGKGRCNGEGRWKLF